MVFVIGELLVDIFPDYKRIGGAPFNFAYHLKNLGVPVRFLSRIGRDAYGEEILSMLKHNQFRADDIQTDPAHATGQVQVSFDEENTPHFAIMEDVAYDHIDFTACAPLKQQPEMIYFGTLIQRTRQGFSRLQTFLDGLDPEVPCFYDANLRQGTRQPEVIHHSLRRADIVKLNEEELDYISREMVDSGDQGEARIFTLMQQYSIRALSLTRGSEGSELFLDDRQHFSVSAQNVDPIVDTVGAGDAYAAILALGWLKHWHPQRMLSLATLFSASICRIEGAVPEDAAFYQHMRNMIEGDANA
ncbi:MAG TPA: PfkB family carbohydrate kinase [Desulfosalsimonadaceae bacterium]|nr:PfkB family carbohydrate kinase [Desulfosalsimonadaceae bacterium]